ncbi:unnamed protein product [Phytophthora fragariaefolia]|uniref:Unnamed protein product n=1 Tax=Phytophthora fragariaefolia TaxID=1490495 RepID=A0A9W6U3Y8_9STRA|nr:unnamed protein product [Phytophthora fragariaefolia]
MVKLFCRFVGEAGNAIPVDVRENETVGDLTRKFATNAQYAGRVDKMQLFLAKTADGAWLPSNDPDVVAMRSGAVSEKVQNLLNGQFDPAEEIADVFVPAPQKKQIHVLVVVPKQGTSVPTVSQDGVFDHCSDPFFSQFSTVDQVGDWLNFSSLLPLTRRQKLYIRSSYRVIADQALLNPDGNMVKYAVVTGTPGVGKSVFVYYVMWRLIKDKKRVLFFSKKGPIYFDGSTMYQSQSLPNKFNRRFWSPELWCLVDSVDPTAMTELPVEDCSVLLASTPRRDCIGEFKKLVPTPDVFYMPLWTTEELANIAPMYPLAAMAWQNRFECLGGVPRVVLQDIGTDPQTLLMSACSSCSLDDCIMLVSIYSEINSKAKIAQTLIHIRSQEPYREYEVAYASELAMQVIARTKWRSDRAKVQNLLGSCDGNPLAQSLCGYVFEPHSMDLLEQGGTFVCRKLLSGADMRKRDTIKRKRGNPVNEDEEAIDIPPSSQPRQIAERVEVGQHANQLYVPPTSNYTAIDAWMPQFGGFQMTVGKTHDIKSGAADDLAKLGQNGNRLFFLLPPLYYKTFTKKTPQTIEQYAILVPYPEQV